MSPFLFGLIDSQKSGHLIGPGIYDSIATATVDSGSASIITFNSISSIYTHLQLRITGFYSQANNMYLRYNNDTAANYSWHQLVGDGASASAYGSGSMSNMLVGNINSASTTTGGVSVIDLLEYANTNTYKTVRSLQGSDANGSGLVALRSGNWRSTSAITSITFSTGKPWQQYSSFALYGVLA